MPPSASSAELWDPTITYVIGHRRPDTDSIAAALGYAHLLTQTGRENIRAVRAGQPGEQARFALNRFAQDAPPLLTAVAPTFGHITKRRPALLPDAALGTAMNRLAEGDQVVPVADTGGRPVGVVTPLCLARAYALSFDALSFDEHNGKWPSAGSVAVKAPTFSQRERLSDHRNYLLRAEENQFLVVDQEGKYIGVADQRDVLQPPRAKLILVDHNELPQAVAGADEAEIVGVLDHHRLGNPPTAAPIPFVVDPVGSTSTLVGEQCQSQGLLLPTGIAGLLLSGILSDTLVFRSPTTSDRDRAVAAWLAQCCGVSVEEYGAELLSASPGLASRSIEDIVDGDRKQYEMAGLPVSIGQVEVTSIQELPERRDALEAALQDQRGREGLSLSALMVTDIVTGRSRLLAAGERRLLAALPFAHVGGGEFDLGDVVSRKKQLVPALQNTLESVT